MIESRLTLVARIPGTRPVRAIFRCTCGTEREFWFAAVQYGKSRSCGCLNIELAKQRRLDNIEKFTGSRLRHGDHGKPTWVSWQAMLSRCKHKTRSNYQYYGGRGITVCERWCVYENFLADMGERPEGKTLDRINIDGNYELSNCRWATQSEQNKNRRPRGPDMKPRKKRAANSTAV